MNPCDRFAAELGAYHDGALTPAERSEFAVHLEQCAGCRTSLTALVSLDAAIRALPRTRPSSGLESALLARLREGAASSASEGRAASTHAPLRRRSIRRLGWSGLALATAAAAAVALVFLPGAEEDLTREDWQIVADAATFELLMAEDTELLLSLDVLEGWEEEEGS